MRDRKIVLLFIATVIFGLGVILWYFFKSEPEQDPTLATPNDPFPSAESRPRGEFIQPNVTPIRSQGDTENERIPASERVLIQIWDKPVGGYAFVTREILVAGTTTPSSSSTPATTSKPTKKTVEYLLFVDRTTGHIYGYNKEGLAPFQVTNTTIAGIYDAYIIQNGTRVFMRYADKDTGTIKTLTGTIPTFIEGADPRQLETLRTLQDNVTSFAVSSSDTAYSYLVPSVNGSSVYTVNAKGATSMATTPLREWTLLYGGEVPYMYNKPSAYLEGSLFSVATREYITGGKTGLIALPSPQGDRTLASMWSSSGLATYLATKAGLRTLEFRTIASKCGWATGTLLVCGIPVEVKSGSRGLPDDWFQGTVNFSDDVYMIDTDSGNITGLLNLAETSGNPFDLTRIEVNKDMSSLVFTNKEDGTPWLVNMKKVLQGE